MKKRESNLKSTINNCIHKTLLTKHSITVNEKKSIDTSIYAYTINVH